MEGRDGATRLRTSSSNVVNRSYTRKVVEAATVRSSMSIRAYMGPMMVHTTVQDLHMREGRDGVEDIELAHPRLPN